MLDRHAGLEQRQVGVEALELVADVALGVVRPSLLGHLRRRAADLRQRVEAGERVQDRPGGRQRCVEALKDLGALNVLAKVAHAFLLRLRGDGRVMQGVFDVRFTERLRQSGVQLRPRMSERDPGQITGYAVALYASGADAAEGIRELRVRATA